MTKNKYIVIKHSILKEISDTEVQEVLPSDKVQIIETFDVKPFSVSMEEMPNMNFSEAAIFQKDMIDKKIVPFIRKNEGCRIAYFGAAPIPLAIHLGYCLGNWNNYEVFNFHQKNKSWAWENKTSQVEQALKKFPQENFKGTGDVVFKVKSSYEIQNHDVHDVIKNEIKELEVRTELLDVTSIKNNDQLNEVANAFADGLASISNNLPNTDTIHLFATVPVGLAFLLGTKISPTINKKIRTYQYFNGRTPKYEPVITLQEVVQNEHPLTQEEIEIAQEIRANFSKQLNKAVKGYIQSKIEEKEKKTLEGAWYELVLKKGNYNNFRINTWSSLPDITEINLQDSKVDLSTTKVEGGFYVTENFDWQIDDRFILGIHKRLEQNHQDTLCALRMFLFHEALHFYQRLNSFTASNIGRFPRILEEADYQADVWTMIHEYSMEKSTDGSLDFKDYFKDLIKIATKTMWAFDDLDPNVDEMQVRRINRYLIWYWHLVNITSRDCKNIEDVINIFSIKPLLEIKGLKLKTDSQRVLAKLDQYQIGDLEIGIFTNNIIERRGNSGGLGMKELINGFKARNGEIIEKQLKAFYELIRSI